MKRRILPLALLVLFACEPSSTVTPLVDEDAASDSLPTPDSQLAILDGTREGGNPGFFWLPPMVRGEPEIEGEFDESLLPFLSVEICEWDGSACVGDPIRTFTSEDEESERLRISTDNDGSQHYIVNWHTGNDDLDPEAIYRISAKAGPVELGHADVDVVQKMREAAAIDAEEYAALAEGRTLPVKFRTTEQLVGAAVVSSSGGTVTSQDQITLVEIPPGAVEEPSLLGVTRAQRPIPTDPGGRRPVVGPYEVFLSSRLTHPASLTIAAEIGELERPEVWLRSDGLWTHHPASGVSETSIRTEVAHFSDVVLWDLVPLADSKNSLLPLSSDDWQIGGPFSQSESPTCEGGCRGWFDASTVQVDGLGGAITTSPPPLSNCSGPECGSMRGQGGSLLFSGEKFEAGAWSARLRFDDVPGMRYALFLSNGECSVSQRRLPGDEATIEFEQREGEWRFQLTTWRRELLEDNGTDCPFDINGDGKVSEADSKVVRQFFAEALLGELPPFSFTEWHTITLERTSDNQILAYVDGELFADTGPFSGTREGCRSTAGTCTNPAGQMNLLLEAWPPLEEGFLTEPLESEAVQDIAWVSVGTSPVAEFTVETESPVAGSVVRFNAERSGAVGTSTILSYEWTISNEDSGTFRAFSEARDRVDILFSRAGTNEVSLTVVDDLGRSSEARMKTITVGGAGEVDGLVAHYPLDGDGTDASGNGWDGNVVGATVADGRDGTASGALEFDGGDYVSTLLAPTFQQGESFSISAWFKTSTDQPDGMGIIGLEVTNNQELSLQTRSQRAYGYVRDDGPGRTVVQTFSGSTVDDGEWHHAVLVRDASADEIRLYLDEVLVDTQSDATTTPINGSSAQPFAIGAVNNSSFGMIKDFVGAIDEVKIFGEAVTAAKVDELCDVARVCDGSTGSTLYFEDFSSSPTLTPGYTPKSGEFFQWNSVDEIYEIRILEENGAEKFTYSSPFSRVSTEAFTISVDMYIEQESWGLPHGMMFSDGATGTAGLVINHTGTSSEFVITDVSATTSAYRSAPVAEDRWYTITLDYFGDGTANIEIRDRATGSAVAEHTGVAFVPGPFDRAAYGAGTLNSDGTVAEIHYDNVRVQVGGS